MEWMGVEAPDPAGAGGLRTCQRLLGHKWVLVGTVMALLLIAVVFFGVGETIQHNASVEKRAATTIFAADPMAKLAIAFVPSRIFLQRANTKANQVTGRVFSPMASLDLDDELHGLVIPPVYPRNAMFASGVFQPHKSASRCRAMANPVMSDRSGEWAVVHRPVLQPAPPPPPAPPGNSGGRGGDGEEEVLHNFADQAATELLDDWIARTTVHAMSSEFGNTALAKVHKESLENLKAFRSFSQNTLRASDEGKKMLIGLHRDNDEDTKYVALGRADEATEYVALAGGFIKSGFGQQWPGNLAMNQGGSFVIKYMASNPIELTNIHTVAHSRMEQGLRCVAEAFGVELMMPFQDLGSDENLPNLQE